MTKFIPTRPATQSEYRPQPLRVQVAWRVLEAAKDAADPVVIAACRRIITGQQLPGDVALVCAFDH